MSIGKSPIVRSGKIFEEMDEFLDSLTYLEKNFDDISMNDLKTMSDTTKIAFINGRLG